MRNWIANLLRRQRKPSSRDENAVCVYSIAEDSLRVEVFEHLLPCGHPAYSLHGEYYAEELSQWISVLNLRDYNAETAVWLLRQAAAFIAALGHGQDSPQRLPGVRALPTVRLWGKRYYIDERLKELRSVENPHERVQLVPAS